MADPRGTPIPPDFVELAPRMHKNALARHYGVRRECIGRWLKKTGMTCAPPPSYAPPLRKTSVSRRKRPMPDDFAEMAGALYIHELRQHYKTSDEIIRRWMGEAGITPRRFVRANKALRHAPRLTMVPITARVAMCHEIAADTLRRERWVVYRCTPTGKADLNGSHWRAGNTVLTPDELLAKAARYEKRAA